MMRNSQPSKRPPDCHCAWRLSARSQVACVKSAASARERVSARANRARRGSMATSCSRNSGVAGMALPFATTTALSPGLFQRFPRQGWPAGPRDSSGSARRGRGPPWCAALRTRRLSAQKLCAIGLIVGSASASLIAGGGGMPSRRAASSSTAALSAGSSSARCRMRAPGRPLLTHRGEHARGDVVAVDAAEGVAGLDDAARGAGAQAIEGGAAGAIDAGRRGRRRTRGRGRRRARHSRRRAAGGRARSWGRGGWPRPPRPPPRSP